jgi:hypothetical protein
MCVAVVIAGVGGDARPASAAEPAMMRVRSAGDPTITTLLRNAPERSVTFRRLVETINHMDGLVYVHPGKCRQRPACLLMSVTIAGPNRVLHIRINTDADALTAMSSMGHELQHAIEALSESGVRSNMSLEAFFERLAGSPTASGQLEFETEAVIQAGVRVRDELRDHR